MHENYKEEAVCVDCGIALEPGVGRYNTTRGQVCMSCYPLCGRGRPQRDAKTISPMAKAPQSVIP
jgi:hypothetical protein